eukprot:UN34095
MMRQTEFPPPYQNQQQSNWNGNSYGQYNNYQSIDRMYTKEYTHVDNGGGFGLTNNNSQLDKVRQQLLSMSTSDIEHHLTALNVRFDPRGSKTSLIREYLEHYKQKNVDNSLLHKQVLQRQGIETSGPPGFDNTIQRKPPGFAGDSSRNTYVIKHASRTTTSKLDTKTRMNSNKDGKQMENNQVNWGAVRQLKDGQWQTRTPKGVVLPELFTTREDATLFFEKTQTSAATSRRTGTSRPPEKGTSVQ